MGGRSYGLTLPVKPCIFTDAYPDTVTKLQTRKESRMKQFIILSALTVCLVFTAAAQKPGIWNTLIGSAYADNHSYTFLRDLCDQAGGRVLGSRNNERALGILEERLAAVGLAGEREKFSVPCWIRGDDEVLMTTPIQRKLRAVALGYVDATPAFEAPVVFA